MEVTIMEVVPAANVTVPGVILLVSLLSQVYVTVPPVLCAGAEMSTLAVKNVLVLQAPTWSPGHALNATPVTLNWTGAVIAVAVGDVPPCVGATVGVDVALAV
jgi:hypothetical protein